MTFNFKGEDWDLARLWYVIFQDRSIWYTINLPLIQFLLFPYISNYVSQSEREEFENEFKQQYEREKVLLTEENKKLTSELDKVSDTIQFLFPECMLYVLAPW